MPKEYKIISIVALVILLGISCIVALGAWEELNTPQWVGCSWGGYVEQESIRDAFPIWAMALISPALLLTIWWALPFYLFWLSVMAFVWLVFIYVAYRPCITAGKG